MRKRMIFRSSQIAGYCVAASVLAGAAWAQEVPAQERPSVHVVVEGETLWDLASRYFGDPFLWPEIYRINTTIVEDPHWIFPGEELRLDALMAAGMEPGQPIGAEPGVEQAPEALRGERPPEQVPGVEALPPPVAPPPPPSSDAPTIFARRRGPMAAEVIGVEAYRRRAVRRYEFHSSGFLTEDQALPFGSVIGRVGQQVLRNIEASSFAQMFDRIAIYPPEGATYQLGDSLLIAALPRRLAGWGEVVVPSGIARVTEITSTGAVAEVIAQFGQVTDGQVVLPIEAFPDPGDVMPVPVENGMMGAIIDLRQRNVLANQQQLVFLDLGRAAGVTTGDVFVVLKPSVEAGASPKPVAYLRIVHVRDQSSTGFIVNIMDLGIEAGAPVQLIRKMPS